MRPIRSLVAVLAASLAAAAGAMAQQASAPERILVRAGEHAGFSRLAFDLPATTEWRIDLDGRRLLVTFPDRRFDFDVRQIFPERRVTRVTAARAERGPAGGTALRLTLSCDCEAEAYRFAETMLVVDLRPRDPRSRAPSRAPTRNEPTSGNAPAPTPPDPARSPSTAPAARGPGPDPADAAIAPDVRTQPEPDGEPNSVAQARDRLLRQLTRAADQGLIAFRETEARPNDASPFAREPAVPRDSADSSVSPTETESASASASASITQAQPASVSSPVIAEDAVQLEARTAFDPLGRHDALVTADDAARRAARCRGDDWLDAIAWAGGEARSHDVLLQRIGRLRAAIVNELDRPAEDEAVRLAKLYLSLGFGAEARQALSAFGADSERVAWLRVAAAVLDGTPDEAVGRLASHSSCGARLGLWRLAAGLPPTPEALAEDAWRGSILEAFEALPITLRRALAPKIVETLLAHDALDLAEAAALRLARAPGDHGDAWRLAAALLALRLGDASRAEATLSTVAAGGGPEAERALLALTERDLAAGRKIPEERLQRLGAAAFVNRGTPLGLDLLVAEVRGRAGKGELSALFDAFAGRLPLTRRTDDAVAAALRRALETLSAEDVGPVAYAEAVLGNRRRLGGDAVWDPARRRIAEELIAIGLPNAAREMLTPALARADEHSNIAAARAEAAMWRGDPALARLETLEGDAPAALRTQIHALAGRHDDAFLAASADGASSLQAELAFRAGRWEAARDAELDATRVALAEAMIEGFERSLRLPPADDPRNAGASAGAPSLAAARDAIARASRLRDMVKEILEDG